MDRFSFRSFLAALVIAGIGVGRARAEDAVMGCSTVATAVQLIGEPDTSRRRAERARDVDKLLVRDPSCGNPEVVAKLIDFLGDRNGAVQFWSAVALGHIGAPAASAIPVLEKAIQGERKTLAEFSSIGGFRAALKRIKADVAKKEKNRGQPSRPDGKK